MMTQNFFSLLIIPVYIQVKDFMKGFKFTNVLLKFEYFKKCILHLYFYVLSYKYHNKIQMSLEME